MKNILIAFCLFVPFAAFTQLDTSKPALPMKNGKVCYEKTYTVATTLTKNAVYSKALQWLKTAFPAYSSSVITNKTAGTIAGTGIFKVAVNANGNYYWLRPVIGITVVDGSYTIQLVNFYEKPIEKGITNDYSKIEYRWRDFNRGRPWSQEDYPLFRGLDANAQSIMASLEKAVNE